MVDGRGPAGVAAFFSDAPLEVGRVMELAEGEAHHARVRRLEAGARVRLLDGAGGVASGVLASVSRRYVTVAVQHVSRVPEPPAIHLLAPIADRDRMLWLAEKATELGLTSWRAVLWRRSRGVSPRGEGTGFQARLRSRMIGALTQSGGAWLPTILPDATVEEAYEAAARSARYFLAVEGEPVLATTLVTPLTVALGPEGGLDDEERSRLEASGWIPLSLGDATLRFETAGIAALAVVRAVIAANVESPRG
ncbi:MAG: RsmE family RNA methyltransferase [Gemmatimonadaceae bacterium]